jgi:hypothetical protein
MPKKPQNLIDVEKEILAYYFSLDQEGKDKFLKIRNSIEQDMGMTLEKYFGRQLHEWEVIFCIMSFAIENLHEHLEVKIKK